MKICCKRVGCIFITCNVSFFIFVYKILKVRSLNYDLGREEDLLQWHRCNFL